VPVLGARNHLAVGKLAHLVAHRLERLVETAGADRRILIVRHQRNQPRAALRRIPGGDQVLDVPVKASRDLRGAEPVVGRTYDLVLAHRNSAGDLREVLADADTDDVLFDLAELAGAAKTLRIAAELPDRLDIGRKPGQPVNRMLFAVDQPIDDMALDHDPFADFGRCVRQQSVSRRDGAAGGLEEAFGSGTLGWTSHGLKGCEDEPVSAHVVAVHNEKVYRALGRAECTADPGDLWLLQN
jgi:hypothetical protein